MRICTKATPFSAEMPCMCTLQLHKALRLIQQDLCCQLHSVKERAAGNYRPRSSTIMWFKEVIWHTMADRLLTSPLCSYRPIDLRSASRLERLTWLSNTFWAVHAWPHTHRHTLHIFVRRTIWHNLSSYKREALMLATALNQHHNLPP